MSTNNYVVYLNFILMLLDKSFYCNLLNYYNVTKQGLCIAVIYLKSCKNKNVYLHFKTFAYELIFLQNYNYQSFKK